MIIDNQLLGQVSGQAKKSERLRVDFNSHETLGTEVQRLPSTLEIGAALFIHRHQHTAETYILLYGRIDTMLYNADEGEMECYELHPGNGVYGVYTPRGQWHILEVLGPSAISEVRDGSYMLLDKEDILKQLLVRSF